MSTRRGALVLWLGLLLGPSLAAGQHAPPTATKASADTAVSGAELHMLGAELMAPDHARRSAAFLALRSLGDDALPAMRARLAELRARGFDVGSVLSAMTAFRRVQGVEAPDGEVDLAEGVLRVLESDHGRGAALAAELVALLRALEAQKSPAAGEIIVGELFALDSKLFRYEAPRTLERLRVLLIPALIRHHAHPKWWVRRFAEQGRAELRVDAPGRAVQQDDVVLLSAILDAYGDTLTFDAMPVVVSYVTDERVAVRDAARRATHRFGRNAIWQLRERYVNATGREADPNWGFQRTLDELIRLHEGPKQEAFAAALDQATRALDAGDAQGAEATLDRALHQAPHSADGKRAAPLYMRIAAIHLDDDALSRALASYRRALRLEPSGVAAPLARARILYLEAELRLTQGVVDLEAYRAALALDPSFTRAAEALDALSGERAARKRLVRQALGGLAALLMVFGGLALLWNRGNEPTAPEPTYEEPDSA